MQVVVVKLEPLLWPLFFFNDYSIWYSGIFYLEVSFDNPEESAFIDY